MKMSLLVAGLFLTLSTSAFANNAFDGDHVVCSVDSAFAAGTVTAVDLKFNNDSSKVKIKFLKTFDGKKIVDILGKTTTTGIATQSSLNDRTFTLQTPILGNDTMNITANKRFVVLINSSTGLVSQIWCHAAQ